MSDKHYAEIWGKAHAPWEQNSMCLLDTSPDHAIQILGYSSAPAVLQSKFQRQHHKQE